MKLNNIWSNKMSKENNMIEIFAHPDGRIAYKVTSTGKVFELEPTGTKVVGPEGYANVTEGMSIAIPVGGGESWSVDILVSKQGDLVIFVHILDEYIKAEKIPVSPDYIKEFESKGAVDLSEKMLEAGRIWKY
jgi:hypothetical protein